MSFAIEKHRGKILFWTGALAALAVGWVGYPQARLARVTQPVAFSHKIHTGQAGMKCDDCHSLREDGSFTGVPGLTKCAECHAQAMGNSREEKAFIDRYVTPGREIPWQTYARQPENVHFSHAAHLKLAHVDCVRCHGALGAGDRPRPALVNRISGYSGSPTFLKMDDCMDCHRQRGAGNSCIECHQ